MSPQADGVVSNGTGSAVRSDINNQYAALWSNHSGSTEPSSGKVAYQFWADTNTSILKIRNSANNAWINLFTLAGGIDVDAASNFNEDVTFTGASFNLVWDKSDNALEFADNAKATFGNADLIIFHDGTYNHIDAVNNHPIIANAGTSDFYIKGGNVYFMDEAANEYYLKAIQNGSVELMYDNSKKFNTNSEGIQIHGKTYAEGDIDMPDNAKLLIGNSDDLEIFSGGTGGKIHCNTGVLELEGDSVQIWNHAANEAMAKFTANGAVEIYRDGSLKLTTATGGIIVYGDLVADNLYLGDNEKLYCGASNDMQIFHDSSGYNYVYGSTPLYVQSNTVELQSQGGEKYLKATVNNAVEIYYNDSKKAYTYNEGWKVDGYIKALADLSDAHGGDNTGDYHTLQSSSETSSTLLLEHSGNSTPRGIYAFFSDAAPDNATQYFLYCEDNAAIRAKINSNGSFESADNSYGGISDIKLKENIVDANSQWNDIKALKIRNFNFKRKPNTKLLGVVAQEVETISPGLVDESEDLELGGVSKGTTTKSVKYSILYMKAIKALQEAMTRIETLETKVTALESS